MVPMRQHFDGATVADLDGEVSRGIREQINKGRAKAGETVAIGVGSRGVSPIRQVVSAVVREVKAAGLLPFIVPAMGSHGGGTAEGQRRVLSEYGITEANVGAPVRATMDTVILGVTSAGADVYGDLYAYGADHVVIIARVKPHTGFRSDIESGLCKMLSVGLGKRAGAARIHEGALAETIPAAAAVALGTGKVLFGVALVENAFDRPYKVKVAGPDEFLRTDRELLVEAKRILPRIPTDHLHLLVVDQMGKNYSGTGMDTNVIGMWRRIGGERKPDYGWLAVLRLSKASEGNAAGIGLADFTTQALVEAMDREQTYVNALTALVPFMARIPVTYPSDRECLESAAGLAQRSARGAVRAGRIRNTLELDQFWVTPEVAAEMERAGSAQACGRPAPFAFNGAGELEGLAD